MPRRPRTILDDLPFKRRLLARGALGAAQLISAINRPKRGGSGTLLVAYANLGDQLRMLNVLSRFLGPGDQVDAACNAGTQQAFELYPAVRSVRAFGAQGAGGLREALALAVRTQAPYNHAIVPHPFVTQPLAASYAKASAATVSALTEDQLSHESWRAAYERFFERLFGYQPIYDRPQVREDLRWHGEPPEPLIIVHLATGAASRALDSQQCAAIVTSLKTSGARVVALGSGPEREQLESVFSDTGAEIWCGRPLPEIARLLARASLFVGLDSSMMNLADAVGTPSMIVYPTTSPRIAGPFYTSSVAVTPQRYEPVGVQALTSWSAGAPSSGIPVRSILDALDTELRRLSRP